jgi:hypothetical protein
MRLRIKQVRPINLNDAIRHAVELEAFNKAELKRNEGGGYLRSAAERDLPGALHLDLTRAVSQQLFAFFLLAEFYTTQSGSRANNL